jgi:hypothetical protein
MLADSNNILNRWRNYLFADVYHSDGPLSLCAECVLRLLLVLLDARRCTSEIR